MRLQKSSLHSGLVLAALSAAILTAQSAPPRRAPDVAYVPTSTAAVDAMLQLADVKKTDTVYDLGCGDGRIVIAAARKRGARGVGIDIDPARVREARENAGKAGVGKRVRFEENDIFQADIRQASVVTLFLLPELNLKLLPKLLRDLRPGTRIVSNTFDMGDWPAAKEVTVGDPDEAGHPFSHKLYLWIIPPANGTARGGQQPFPRP
jgi:SAM-dependent methyltransferase